MSEAETSTVETSTVVSDVQTAREEELVAKVLAAFADALSSVSALAGLDALWDRLDAPRSLRDLGFEKEAIPGAVEAIMPLVPESNPVTVTAGELADLLTAAWQGTRPEMRETT